MFNRVVLVCIGLLTTVSAWAQNSPATSHPALTAIQQEAQKHFKVAQTAINDGNYDVALSELQKASALDGKNSYIWYDLAVVQSKKGMDQDALDSLNKVENLGLPASLKDSASELRGTLTYNVEKTQGQRQAAPVVNVKLSADDTVQYLNDKLNTYGFKLCDGPQILRISPDRQTIILTNSGRVGGECKVDTFQIPAFDLEVGYFGQLPVDTWDQQSDIVEFKDSNNVHFRRLPATGDYSHLTEGGIGIFFACKDGRKCIVKNGGDHLPLIHLAFFAPDEQVSRIRKAMIHLADSLGTESQQHDPIDPFAK